MCLQVHGGGRKETEGIEYVPERWVRRAWVMALISRYARKQWPRRNKIVAIGLICNEACTLPPPRPLSLLCRRRSRRSHSTRSTTRERRRLKCTISPGPSSCRQSTGEKLIAGSVRVLFSAFVLHQDMQYFASVEPRAVVLLAICR